MALGAVGGPPGARAERTVAAAGTRLVPDPYQWLEDDTPDALAWQDAQDEYAARCLVEWSGHAVIAALLESLPTGRLVSAPRHHGDTWFRAIRVGGVDGGSVVVHAGPSHEPESMRPVIAPPPSGESLWEYWPSPDGRLVAYATTKGGCEGGELRVIDVASRQPVTPPSLFTTWTRLAWLPDSTGFYFNGIALEPAGIEGRVWFQAASDHPPEAQAIDHIGLDAYPSVSADGKQVIVSIGLNELRPAYRLDRAASQWHRLASMPDRHFHGVPADSGYVALTTLGADKGRVVVAPIDALADPSQWHEIVAESKAAIRAISVVDRWLVLSELVDGCGQLRVVDLRTPDSATYVVRLPAGAIATSGTATPLIGVPMVHASTGHNEVTFLHSTPATPPTAYRYDLAGRSLEQLDRDNDRQPATVSTTTTATAADGADLPCRLTHLATLDTTRPQPTLLLVYGGWNLPNTPRYSPAAAAFVLAGGIVAHAVVRGGGEYGRAWWLAGRGRNKQTTFDDLYAIAESLVAGGVTDSTMLGLQGGSAGGLAAGVATTQRPELFAAIAATAPMLDMLRFVCRPGGSVEPIKAELGDPANDDDAAVLASYSPCNNAAERAYTPVFVGAPEHDVRTPVWQARKFVAALLAADTSDAPVLLRIWRGRGHATGTPATGSINTEWLSFIARHVGLLDQP